MTSELKARVFNPVWSSVALPGEEFRYGFTANPAGTGSLRSVNAHWRRDGSLAPWLYRLRLLFGPFAWMLRRVATSGETNIVQGASEHFPMDANVVVAVGSHRLRVWSGKGRPERLLGDVSYQSIATIQVKRVGVARTPVGDVSLTFADRSRTSFETELGVAEHFVAMVMPFIGGLNAVREESLQHRQAVAQIHERAAA